MRRFPCCLSNNMTRRIITFAANLTVDVRQATKSSKNNININSAISINIDNINRTRPASSATNASFEEFRIEILPRKIGHTQDHVFVKVEIRPELNVLSRETVYKTPVCTLLVYYDAIIDYV